MLFRQIFDERLAQYAYLVGCQRTGEALVIDPQRDIDRYLTLAEAEEVRIVAVTETHIHADFLSGTREFAARGVTVYLSDEGDEDWKYRWPSADKTDVRWLHHGDTFAVGNIQIKALHTPGHTPEHMAFLITDTGGGADEPMGLASGDFVFVGDLGRPDLLESAAGVTGAMEPSARRLYASAQDFLQLPDYLQVWPGHGAGSACGKALGAVPESTVGYERRFNPALQAVQQGESTFVRFILEGQPEPPMYFADMKRLNKEGAPVLGSLPSPPVLDVDAINAAVGDGAAVILDTRLDRIAFFAGHLPGSIFAPLDKSFPTIAGSYVVLDQPVYLVAQPREAEEAIRELVRIGRDRVLGIIPPEHLEIHAARGGHLASIPSTDFSGVRDALKANGPRLLDVRRATEFAEGHLPGAQNVAHTRLLLRLDEVPADEPLMVYCRTGSRAASAVSLLAREGRQVTHVNDDVWNWREPVREGVVVE